eukprot:1161392-Pelagomonas_calceolata.AAC.5
MDGGLTAPGLLAVDKGVPAVSVGHCGEERRVAETCLDWLKGELPSLTSGKPKQCGRNQEENAGRSEGGAATLTSGRP